MSVDPADMMPEPSGFVAFRGQGNRLDGKRRKDSTSSDPVPPKPTYVRGIPDYDYEIGMFNVSFEFGGDNFVFFRYVEVLEKFEAAERPERIFGGVQGFQRTGTFVEEGGCEMIVIN